MICAIIMFVFDNYLSSVFNFSNSLDSAYYLSNQSSNSLCVHPRFNLMYMEL